MLCGGNGGTAPPGTIILTSGLALFSAVSYGQNISYISLTNLLQSVDVSGLQDVVCRRWSAGRGLEAVSKEKWIPVPIGNKIPVVQYLALLALVEDFLGALEKLLKATVSSVVSVCPSVLMKQLGPRWMDFHEFLYLSIFRKSVEKIQVCLQNLIRPMHIYDNISPSSSSNWKYFRQSCRENQNAYFTLNNFFPRTSCSL
jgi:hypothetical protein